MRPSDRYPKEVRSEFSSMVILDEENEEDDEEGKESMLKLFLMVTQVSKCTPKRRSPTKVEPLKDVQVLELCPMTPQCEHFLPIFSLQKIKIFSATEQPLKSKLNYMMRNMHVSVCMCV